MIEYRVEVSSEVVSENKSYQLFEVLFPDRQGQSKTWSHNSVPAWQPMKFQGVSSGVFGYSNEVFHLRQVEKRLLYDDHSCLCLRYNENLVRRYPDS